jgi:hypothetical protein
MITDNYIKMCEKAGEIQKEWRPKDLDTFCYTKSREIGEVCADNKKHTQKEYDDNLKHQFWLPTLEQLFKMWCNLCQTTNFAGLSQRIGEHKRSKITTYPNIKHIKEMCLEVIMKEFYHKIWTGEKWEAVK